ncbi:MAG TPA: type II toxin-antitoxin system VapC family toxin [Candidatus Tectomicrobia bacterium]
MPHLAIDASTAAKWQLSEEPEAERARHMLRDYAAAKVTFVAPTIWHYEVANIVNKAVGTRRLSEEEGHLAFQALQGLDIEFVDFPTPAEAYRLARMYRRSVYDSLYLAVAQHHQIDLWTGDHRLYNAVRQSLPFVKWIGDYPLSVRL